MDFKVFGFKRLYLSPVSDGRSTRCRLESQYTEHVLYTVTRIQGVYSVVYFYTPCSNRNLLRP